MENPGSAKSVQKSDCVFCNIVGKNIESFPFWENENFIAFLSIYPNTPGVSVVIPKKHYPSDVLSLPNNYLTGLIFASKEVSVILSKLPGVGRVAVIFEGFGVNHSHTKLFPMHGTKMHEWVPIKSKITTYFEKYEGYVSSHDGPRESDLVLKKMQEQLVALKQIAN